VASGAFDDVDLRGGVPGGRWAGREVGASGAGYSGPLIGFRQAGGRLTVTGSGDIGPVVAGGVNSGYVTGTLADHLLGVFIGLLIMVVIAAMFITVEFRHGLIRTTLAASPRRGRLLAAWVERYTPTNAGLAILNTTGLQHLAISPWAGLGVLAAWAAAALLAAGLLLRLRDA